MKECAPENCPALTWANMSEAERKAYRKREAERLYKQKFSMEEIAALLGVGFSTIQRDLSDLPVVGKLKAGKSATNPKGAGRPKGKKKAPAIEEKHEKIIALADAGMKSDDIADTVGVGARMVDRVREIENARREEREPEPDEKLSMTAQQKLDAAIKQAKRKLEAEFEYRVRAELKKHLDAVALPHYAKQIGELERSIRERKGVMDAASFRKIWACLHPDRFLGLLQSGEEDRPRLLRRYEEAFDIFKRFEKQLLSEKDSPTTFQRMPKTYEDLMAMKAKVDAERRAKREAARNAKAGMRG